ncbi:glycerol dehydrogenase (plasmid) [Haloferacaceae archaeon DSL9]
MSTRLFRSPAAYLQGRDVLDTLGDHAHALGATALVIGDDTVLGLIGDRAVESFENAGIDATTESFEGEASEAEITRLSEIARDRGADIVVGAGGGKALDTAKAVRENVGGAMVSLPTVASTDAPTSALSVIYTAEGEFEEYRFYDRHPDLVLVDTAVIAAAPTRLFRSGIGDALATWFEADATFRSGSETLSGARPTRAGHDLARLCYTTLREHGVSAVDAVERDVATESVEAITEANTLLSGLGFESGGLAAAHAIHNGLTQLDATHGATHGEKVAVGTLAQLVLEGRDDAFLEEIVAFTDAVGLPVTLAEIGLPDPEDVDLEVVAEAACDPSETIHNEPFGVTPEMVASALKAVDAVGRRVVETR